MSRLLSTGSCSASSGTRDASCLQSLRTVTQQRAKNTHKSQHPRLYLFSAQSQLSGSSLRLSPGPKLPRRSCRVSALRTTALVNVEFNPALLLGLAVMSSGVVLYQLRQQRTAISRDTDLFISCICLCSGGILVFQGWRLDPLLLLCQLFTTTVALSYAWEALQARQNSAPPQIEQQKEKADPRARSQQVYEYQRGRGFELPPPANEDAYSEWARDNAPARWRDEESSWQEAGSRGDFRSSQQQASRQSEQSYGRFQPAETSSSRRHSNGYAPQNGYRSQGNDYDDGYDYDSNGYPLARQRQSNGYSQTSQRSSNADRRPEGSDQQAGRPSQRDYDQDRDAYRDRGSSQKSDWQSQRQTAGSGAWSSRPSANADDEDDWDLYS